MPPSKTPGLRRPETLLQQSAEPIFLLSPAGRLIYANAAWEHLTGATVEEAHADPDGDGSIAERFRPPPEVAAGEACSATTLLPDPNGSRSWWRLDFWPHRDHRGAPLFTLGMVRPVAAPNPPRESASFKLRSALWKIQDELETRLGLGELIGFGPAHDRLLRQVEAALGSRAPTMLIGPAGSGKRHIARVIHRRSGDPSRPFVVLDCAALSADELERELFELTLERIVRAARERSGDRPTVMLLEPLRIPRDVQRRLAETLNGPEAADARWVAGSAEPLEPALEEDRLRADLYYALTALAIRLPPLSERLEELPVFAQHFLERANAESTRRLDGFEPAAIDELVAYDWPGQLDELNRVVRAAWETAEGPLIRPADLPASMKGNLGGAYLPPPIPREDLPLDATLERVERRLIERALRSAKGNKSLASKILNVSRARLHRRIQELGVGDGRNGFDRSDDGNGHD